MSRIKPKELKFEPPASTDVVAWEIYIDSPNQLDYRSPKSSGTDFTVQTDGKVHVDVGGLDVARNVDGIYDVGLVFVDDVGNQSDMTKLPSVALDFIAPAAPTGLAIA